MRSGLAKFVVGVAMLAVSGPAVAQEAQDCRQLSDAAERLACFDGAAAPQPTAPAAPGGWRGRISRGNGARGCCAA